ncbi:MAG: PqqD family protein, partial [Prevotella sp.]|nr:PqqD family protein [Paraprevotella sp.]MDD5856208.1 PqqD family protein [Prevotella sp.]MDD7691545.1 PqqD family protein [Prevotella sp.]MDY4409204.1 PqqD family protein [Prevotella sp.]
MRAKKGFKLRNICGENIIVAEGKENIDFTNIISMNETSAFLWEQIEQKDNFDAETLTELLLDNYDVDKETALNDASELIKQWLEAEIIE